MTTLTMMNEFGGNKRSAALLTSHLGMMRKREETVPTVGTVININPLLIVFTDADGNPKTPMTKARFNMKSRRWEQVSPAEAGLLLFFDGVAPEDVKRVRITRVIPNGRAAYVVPA